MGCIGKCMKKPNINLAPSTLAKKAMDGVGLLPITVTPLTRDDLQQRGHWDQKPGERLGKEKKNPQEGLKHPLLLHLSFQSVETKIWNAMSSCQFESAPHRLMQALPPRISPSPCWTSCVALVQHWRPFLLPAQSAGQNGNPAAYY